MHVIACSSRTRTARGAAAPAGSGTASDHKVQNLQHVEM